MFQKYLHSASPVAAVAVAAVVTTTAGVVAAVVTGAGVVTGAAASVVAVSVVTAGGGVPSPQSPHVFLQSSGTFVLVFAQYERYLLQS